MVLHFGFVLAGTVVFGGKGPGSVVKPPSLQADTPGPGAYTPASQGQCLSTKRRVPACGFGIESKGNKQMMDTSHCFHKDVPIDMSHATAQNLSPGPGYNPSWAAVQSRPHGGVIGTQKRFRPVGDGNDFKKSAGGPKPKGK